MVRCWGGFDGCCCCCFFFFFFPLSLSLLVAGFLVELKAIVMWLWFVGAMMVVVG